jgi:histidyl-tRNA synthetase
MGLSEYVEYDANVIRGLDYYTGSVFEARAANKEGRAILGGGHYDNLVEDVGGEPLPGVGFAMGDVMLPLVLKQCGLLDSAKKAPADVLVTIFDENCRAASIKLAMGLREQGIRTICYPEVAKLPRQLKSADRLGIRFAFVIGPDEMSADSVTIKDLANHSQETVRSEEAVRRIAGMLA